MNKLFLVALFGLLPHSVSAFEIFALGTSNTNCHGVDRTKTFTARLQELLRADGFDAIVINGGLDGDKPVWMLIRLENYLNANTKLVIFEPGPNDKNRFSNLEGAKKVLGQLQVHKVPTIYVSTFWVQTSEEARETAKKYGAYYYGHWGMNVPIDREHWQRDVGNRGGHMTAEGCQLWAKDIYPLVKQVIREHEIK